MTQAPTDVSRGAPAPVDGQDTEFWRSHTQISLQPVAAPSILGLYGFAASTFIVAGYLAGMYGSGNPGIPLILFPLALFFGGLAQFLSGMWSYRARDGLATAMHGMWGSFWLAYGLFWFLIAIRALPAFTPATRTAQLGLGFWFVVLAAITWVGAVAALARNVALSLVLFSLAAGVTIIAIAWIVPYSTTVVQSGAWILVASAVFAFYTASALMLESTFRVPVLPVGHLGRRAGPRRMHLQPIQYELGGEPGVKAGQ